LFGPNGVPAGTAAFDGTCGRAAAIRIPVFKIIVIPFFAVFISRFLFSGY
jgi:hypothetical protein